MRNDAIAPQAPLEDGSLASLQGELGEQRVNDEEDEGSDPSRDPSNDAFWIRRARSAYTQSKSWFDIAIRNDIEDSLRMFASEHPRGSRYKDEAYQKRSKLFRPKTRAAIRKLEASTAAAFFATQDALTCTPPNPRDPRQRQAADAMAELLNYRLQHDIPWYITCLGAMQDCAKQKVVISRQQWIYREVTSAYEEEEIDVMTDEVMGRRTTYETKVVADHPDIVLRPVENILFSAAADWRNPVQTSPYLIDMEPFYVQDVMERAKRGPQGRFDVGWRKLDEATIRSTLRQDYDPIRQAREGHREDRYDEAATEISEHDIVWVHHNYMLVDGEEWYFATLGTEVMLTDVVPLEAVTPLQERPYVLGFCVLETHKPYPSSLIELGKPLQEEVNDLTNLRIENIRHVISPRYFVKRGTSVDVRSLLRNVPGGVTAMEDPKNDVNIRQISDTTGSSFQEQDRLSVEFDELLGNFSQSTVAANHAVNDRVGNTQMMGESANQVTEMTVRLFSETWVEPVLQQIMELERALESDAVVMAIVGQRMDLPPQMVFQMLSLPVKVTVNVGFGATNPQRRLQKVAMAFATLAQINPQWVMGADQAEVTTEVLGAVGFKSAERFFPAIAGSGEEGEDPRYAQLMEENQKLKQMLEGKGQELQFKGQIEQMKIASTERVKMAEMQEKQRHEMTLEELQHKVEKNNWHKTMLDHEIAREQNQMRKQELIQQRIALNHTIMMDERQFAMAQQQAAWQMAQPQQQPGGKPGKTNGSKPAGPPQKKIDEESGEPTEAAKADETSPGGLDAIRNTGATNVKKPEAPSPREAKAKQPPVAKEPKAKAPPKAAKAGGQRIASTPKLAGDDKAGVIARGDYGNIPFKEG